MPVLHHPQGDLGGFADHRRQTIFFCGQSPASRQVQVQVPEPVLVPASRYRFRYKYQYLPAGTGAGTITCAGHSPDCRPFNSATANRLAKRAVERSYAVVSSCNSNWTLLSVDRSFK